LNSPAPAAAPLWQKDVRTTSLGDVFFEANSKSRVVLGTALRLVHSTPASQRHFVSLSRFDRRQISESLRQLRQLERQHAGTPVADRIAALVLLKSDPDLTILQVAEHLGRAERSVQRWLEVYRRDGIDGLVSPSVRRGRPKRLDESALRALKAEIQHSRLNQIDEVQGWLKERFGLNFSQSGLWYLLRRDVGAVTRGWVTLHEAQDRQHPPVDATRGVNQRVIDFLNGLPATGNVPEWVSGFRDALSGFLGDVDRISINVNTSCDLTNPGTYSTGSIVTQHVAASARRRVAMNVERERTARPSERLLANAAANGFPVDDYHEPTPFDYFFGGSAYLGTIILWRKRTEPPISIDTLESFASLEPFIIFALSDVVARTKAAQPVNTAFAEALDRMNDDAELSAQEQRIVILQLTGHSYKEMADMLSVTVDTVKKHFQKIHRKTKTRSQSELFAKYFTYRLEV
jgi:transposase